MYFYLISNYARPLVLEKAYWYSLFEVLFLAGADTGSHVQVGPRESIS
jgi:hypothetical protein